MIIIGCDYHPGFQQIAFVDTETGECGERRLEHREEAKSFIAISEPREQRYPLFLSAAQFRLFLSGFFGQSPSLLGASPIPGFFHLQHTIVQAVRA
jgi:hypothetical protein